MRGSLLPEMQAAKAWGKEPREWFSLPTWERALMLATCEAEAEMRAYDDQVQAREIESARSRARAKKRR